MSDLTDKLRKLAEFDWPRAEVFCEKVEDAYFEADRIYDISPQTPDNSCRIGIIHENARLRPLLDALIECADTTEKMCLSAEASRRMWELTDGASGTSITVQYESVEHALARLQALVDGSEK